MLLKDAAHVNAAVFHAEPPEVFVPRFARPLYLIIPALFALACGDQPQRSPTGPVLLDVTPSACDATVQNRIYTLIDMLWVPGTPEKNAKGHFTAMRQKLQEDKLEEARFYMWSIIGNGNERIDKGEFKDPNGSDPPTIGGATSELYGLLFVCGAFDAPPNFSKAIDNGGGLAVIDEAGGDLITKDGDAAIRVPEGALDGDHLFVITPLDELNAGDNCFNAGVKEYGLCMDFAVHPNTTFNKAVTNVVCTHPFGPADEEEHGTVHERLVMGSEDHANPGGVILHERVQDPFALDCPAAAQARLERRSGGGWFAGAGWTLKRLATKAASALGPKSLHAADGLGCQLLGFGTRFRPVDPVIFEDGFESGDAETNWTATGFWNRNTLVETQNQAFVDGFVRLAAGDESNGFLPAPIQGSWAFWYGDMTRGHFGGELVEGQGAGSGGISVSPNSGTLTSPWFSVPNSVDPMPLRFDSWFEIESVNPSGFDLMLVAVEIDRGGGIIERQELGRLNPDQDPSGGSAPVPFTSAGFDAPPEWRRTTLDLAQFRDLRVRLVFEFATVDQLYNGFRGWIVDDVYASVTVRSVSEPAPSLTLSTSSGTASLPLNTSPRQSSTRDDSQ